MSVMGGYSLREFMYLKVPAHNVHKPLILVVSSKIRGENAVIYYLLAF
jgi:hypothetical protein